MSGRGGAADQALARRVEELEWQLREMQEALIAAFAYAGRQYPVRHLRVLPGAGGTDGER